MAKFKKGDRVRLLDDLRPTLLAGSVGTVLEDNDDAPFVSWDGFADGHDAWGLLEDASGCAVSEDDIAQVSP